MIFPIPQKNELTGKIIVVKSVSLSGEFKEVAEKVLKDYNIDCDNGLNVVFKYENSSLPLGFEIPDFSMFGMFRITAENNGGLTGTKTHVINIDDINDDDVPVITNSGLLAEEYDQNDLVILPTITVADKYIQSITAKVEHIDAEGKTTDAYANIATITLSDTEKQVTGSLTPVKAGNSTITVTYLHFSVNMPPQFVMMNNYKLNI